MSAPLEPCPFCGGEVEIVPNIGDSSDWIRHVTRPAPCALEFSAFFLDDDLATVWNTRAEVSGMNRLLYEALAELHRSCMGTPVAGGDGGTYVVGHPTAAVLNKANAALRKARGETL